MASFGALGSGLSRDPARRGGRATSEAYGNGLRLQSAFEPLAGSLTQRRSGAGGAGTNVQQLADAWDEAGNLTSHQDLNHGLTETFGYDANGDLSTRTGNMVRWTSYNLSALINVQNYSAPRSATRPSAAVGGSRADMRAATRRRSTWAGNSRSPQHRCARTGSIDPHALGAGTGDPPLGRHGRDALSHDRSTGQHGSSARGPRPPNPSSSRSNGSAKLSAGHDTGHHRWP